MSENLQVLIEYIEKNTQVMGGVLKHLQAVDQGVKTVDKDAAKMGNTFKESWTELNSKIAVVQKGLQAVKKGYDFAREGAMLDLTTAKFDRLSDSIGTTGQALLGDLKTATRGIYSDMELMASATDFVALGLAKDHEEAVRLAKVAAGLNMNMNQLVLTLTNMTTMRFDAIGVSVDGFKEKVKELEQSGLSADAAFKEAFLLQAEGQLGRVGEAADETAGEFMKLEASIKNMGDGLKKTAAEALLPFVKGLNENFSVMARTNELVAQGIPQHQAYRMAVNDIVSPIEKVNAETESWDRALLNHKGIIIDIAAEQSDFAAGLKDLKTVMSPGLSAAQEEYNEKIAEYNVQLEKAKTQEEREGILAKIDAETEAYRQKAAAISYSIAQQQIEAIIANDPAQAEAALGFLNEMAYGYGMIDEKSQKANEAQLRLLNQAANGEITWDQARRRIEAHNSVVADIPLVADPAKESIYGVKGSSQELTGTLAGTNEKLSAMEKRLHSLDGTTATATVNIVVNGEIPSFGGLTNLGGGGSARSKGSETRGGVTMAGGGQWQPGMTAIVGDRPGGVFTDTTEVITPTGRVLPNKDAKMLRDLGLLGDARAFGLAEGAFGFSRTPAPPNKPNNNNDSNTGTVFLTGGKSDDEGGTEQPATVTSLTSLITSEVTRMGSTMTQATTANVSATQRQTEIQERSNQNITEELRGIRRDLRINNDTMLDSVRAIVQRTV